MNPATEVARAIEDLEMAALARWCQGDPSGFLALYTSDVVYFDPFIDARIDGIEALTAYYEPLRGKIRTLRHEMISPRVQTMGDVAVLTFQFASWSHNGQKQMWNSTEAYRLEGQGWRIFHSHWSFTGAAGR